MSTTTTPSASACAQRLKQELSLAIRDFNRNRLAVLQKAFEEEGGQAVARLESEYDALRDAYFEMVRTQLDFHHYRYRELTNRAHEQIRLLRESLADLEKSQTIIQGFDRVLGTLGRLLITLGL